LPISIKNTTRRPTPKVAFELFKNKVLGEKYELSLVFCGASLAHKLNLQYRNKDKVANVLSFPLSKNSGEIFINLSEKMEFGVKELFIHGLLHLKGMEHGRKMERAEKMLLTKAFSNPTNGSPNRHRH
jgi:probable rRNA maturation factor